MEGEPMSCPNCDDSGEMRAHIELMRLENEDGQPRWAAHAYRTGRALPEITVIVDDPREALIESGWILGAAAMEADWEGEVA